MCCHGGTGSLARREGLTHRDRWATKGTQTRRTAIAVALMSTPVTASEPRSPGGRASTESPQLKADEDKNQAIEHEDQDIPDRSRLDSRGGRDDRAEVLTEIEAACDARQHSRRVDALGKHPRRVRRQQRDRDLAEAVVGQPQHGAGKGPNRKPDGNTKGRREEKLHQRLTQQEASAHDRGDGGAVQHERGGIVDQALTLQDCDDSTGNSEPFCNRGGSDRVGRGHNSPEHDGRSPVDAGEDRMGDGRNRGGRDKDKTNSKQRDRPEIRLEVP